MVLWHLRKQKQQECPFNLSLAPLLPPAEARVIRPSVKWCPPYAEVGKGHPLFLKMKGNGDESEQTGPANPSPLLITSSIRFYTIRLLHNFAHLLA
jgi:hypothetical protein